MKKSVRLWIISKPDLLFWHELRLFSDRSSGRSTFFRWIFVCELICTFRSKSKRSINFCLGHKNTWTFFSLGVPRTMCDWTWVKGPLSRMEVGLRRKDLERQATTLMTHATRYQESVSPKKTCVSHGASMALWRYIRTTHVRYGNPLPRRARATQGPNEPRRERCIHLSGRRRFQRELQRSR